MPHMMPMYWFMTYLNTITLLMITISMIYFKQIFLKMKSNSNTNYYSMWTWKW